ncbi:transcription termination/antitermination protein NusA [Clostridiaceae bacterium 14S0207]|nr:transcription termination/antitermination protein NusA [Clostridiaceae bacterium 14S0207]
MNEEFIAALKEIAKEKGISESYLYEIIEDAVISAYKKNCSKNTNNIYAKYLNNNNNNQNVKVSIDKETGEFHVFAQKKVVDGLWDEVNEIELEDAKEIDPRYEEGDIVEMEVTPRDFGRVAAQSAKQIVVQKIKEASRSALYEEFLEKEYDIITGTITRKDNENILVDLGKIEAVLGPNEQIPSEHYGFNDKIKLYIVEVKKTTKGPQIILSRTHPGLVKRLFELEVPEIYDGTVEIKAISREAGSRSKVAVYSQDENVDPMGACVGTKGTRVQNIVNELNNEKIDIINWDKDPKVYIANALSPAKVLKVIIEDEDNKCAKVIVDDSQLSLAIGKEGQNVRLAARLTGWKIDIKSSSQVENLEEILQEN